MTVLTEQGSTIGSRPTNASSAIADHTDSHERLRIVDGLRAVAVLAVVLFHIFPTLLPGGYIGVDIFFVISGFVISKRYMDPLATRSIHFKEFYLKRIRRLMPAYAFVLLFTTIAALHLLGPSPLINYGLSLAAQGLYAQNIAFWNIGDYFDDAYTKPLLHTWSLAVEEQFYLLFPIAVIFYRKSKIYFIPLLVVGMIVSILAGLYLAPISPKTTFYWLPFRAWEFFAGFLAARTYDRLSYGPSRGVSLAFVAALATLIGVTVWSGPFPSSQSFLAVGGTAVICALQRQVTRQFAMLLDNPIAQHFGRISYSWYLWHWPPIAFFHLKHPEALTPHNAVLLLLAGYIPALLSYYLVENRAAGWAILSSERRAFRSLGIFVGVVTVAGSALMFSGGLTQRYSAEKRPLVEAQIIRSPYRCPLIKRLQHAGTEFCQLNSIERGPGLLLLGDSHADLLKESLVSAADRLGARIYLTKQNCRIIDYGRDSNCPEAGWAALVNQARHAGIEKLVLVSHWPLDFDSQGFETAATRLRQSTFKQIIIQSAMPEGAALDPETYIRNERDWTSVAVPEAGIRSIHAQQNRWLTQLAASDSRIQIVDPLPYLCTHGQCAFADGNRPLYRDTNHLTNAGLARLAPMVEQMIVGR